MGAAEILAAGEAIDKIKIIAQAYSLLHCFKVKLFIALDSKDLFQSLSTHRNSINKSIRGDINVIRHELDTQNVQKIMWIPGRQNLADRVTTCDSSLSLSLQLMLFTRTLPFSFPTMESCSSHRPLG